MKTLIIHYSMYLDTGNAPDYLEEGEAGYEFLHQKNIVIGDLVLDAYGITSAWSDGENIVVSLCDEELYYGFQEGFKSYIDAGFDFLIASVRDQNKIPSDEYWQEKLGSWKGFGDSYSLAPLCGQRTAWISSYGGNQKFPRNPLSEALLYAVRNKDPIRSLGKKSPEEIDAQIELLQLTKQALGDQDFTDEMLRDESIRILQRAVYSHLGWSV